MNSLEILLLIDEPNKILFYDERKRIITNEILDKESLKIIHENWEYFSSLRIQERDLRFNINPNIMIPKFEEIGHKDIMTFFVKKYVIDQDARKFFLIS